MNQVPWRRILERAGDEGPGERGASVINLRDHASGRQQSQNPRRPAGPPSSDLESELKQALDRAQRKEREQSAMRSSRGARNVPPELRSAPMLRPDLAMRQPVVAPPPAQPKTSGARNFLAISLSAAVIGFALYQIGDQWKEMSNEPQTANTAADIPDSFSAVVASGSGIRVEGNRIDMRPSFAAESAAPPPRAETDRQAALDRDIAEAAKLMARSEPKPSSAPVAITSPAADEGMEQTMLRRGHDMVKQGRIESARLLFEHLAEQKSALGAFALAQTYDPKFLQERGITDVAPDDKLAAQWYQRAAELTMAGAR